MKWPLWSLFWTPASGHLRADVLTADYLGPPRPAPACCNQRVISEMWERDRIAARVGSAALSRRATSDDRLAAPRRVKGKAERRRDNVLHYTR